LFPNFDYYEQCCNDHHGLYCILTYVPLTKCPEAVSLDHIWQFYL
jgi:hypothetical protein